jgi:hypothetical protein
MVAYTTTEAARIEPAAECEETSKAVPNQHAAERK